MPLLVQFPLKVSRKFSVKKLALDECHPEDITSEFQKYIVLVNVEMSMIATNLSKKSFRATMGMLRNFIHVFIKWIFSLKLKPVFENM